jgi:GT2 family glycosyltransferase
VRAFLENCLRSIQGSISENQYELIIVDNKSTDDSVSWIFGNAPEAKLIIEEKNIGFGPANNKGIAEASGKYLLLLNPDTVVTAGSIQLMIDFLDKHADAGCVGPMLLNPDGTLQISSYPFPTVAREFWRLFHLDRIIPFSQYPIQKWESGFEQQVDVLQGAAILMPLSVVYEAGLFDEQFFMYTEEVDLCYRVKKLGYTNYWLPDAKIVHYGGQSTRQAALPMFLELNASKLKFIRKYYHGIGAFFYKTILYAASITRVVGLSILGLFRKNKEQEELRNNYWNLFVSIRRM